MCSGDWPLLQSESMHEWFGQRACCSAAHGGVAMRDAAGSPHTGSPDVGWGGQDPSESQHGRRQHVTFFAGAAHKAMPKRPTEEQMERAVAAGDPDPRALRVRGRAFQADGDPMPHAAVDSQTRSAQTLAARQRRRDAVSTAAPRSSLQNSSTHAKDIA